MEHRRSLEAHTRATPRTDGSAEKQDGPKTESIMVIRKSALIFAGAVCLMSGCLFQPRLENEFIASGVRRKLGLSTTASLTRSKLLDIRSLRLSTVGWGDTVGLKRISILRNLISLSVSGDGVTELRAAELKRLEKLEFLEIENTRVSLSHISGFDDLKRLVLYGNREDRIAVKNMNALSSLRYGNTRAEACTLTNLPSLVRLRIMADKCTEITFRETPNIRSLIVKAPISEIDLSHQKGLEEFVMCATVMKRVSLSKNKGLRILQLNCPEMRHLDLSANTQLSSLSVFNQTMNVVPPADGSGLKYVRLENCRLRDYSWLSRCKNLRLVELTCWEHCPGLGFLVDSPTFRTSKCGLRLTVGSEALLSQRVEAALGQLKKRGVAIKIDTWLATKKGIPAQGLTAPTSTARLDRLNSRPSLIEGIREKVDKFPTNANSKKSTSLRETIHFPAVGLKKHRK
jgi:hypothetical protein